MANQEFFRANRCARPTDAHKLKGQNARLKERAEGARIRVTFDCGCVRFFPAVASNRGHVSRYAVLLGHRANPTRVESQ